MQKKIIPQILKKLKIAAAQTVPHKGDIAKNTAQHLALIKQAAEEDVQVIIFPELSLTGYEPDLASSLAFQENDPQLIPFQAAAQQHQMIIVVGAPLYSPTGLHIASCALLPDGSSVWYTKHHLHQGEERFFQAGQRNPSLSSFGHQFSFAICADITHPTHPQLAAQAGAQCYLASVFLTPKGYSADIALLESYARQYQMTIVMANYGGPSGGFSSAGKSVIWSKTGTLLAMGKASGEDLVITEI